MLHAYITSYAICFMATVVIIMLLLIAGVEIDKEEAKHHGAEVEPPRFQYAFEAELYKST